MENNPRTRHRIKNPPNGHGEAPVVFFRSRREVTLLIVPTVLGRATKKMERLCRRPFAEYGLSRAAATAKLTGELHEAERPGSRRLRLPRFSRYGCWTGQVHSSAHLQGVEGQVRYLAARHFAARGQGRSGHPRRLVPANVGEPGGRAWHRRIPLGPDDLGFQLRMVLQHAISSRNLHVPLWEARPAEVKSSSNTFYLTPSFDRSILGVRHELQNGLWHVNLKKNSKSRRFL